MDLEALKRQLVVDEGLRLHAYKDTVGKMTIGVGHNLDDQPISEIAAMQILEDDIADVVADLDREFPWWKQMDEVRQGVLANMCFNMGIVTLKTFHNTLAAMERGDYAGAADGMAASAWAKQVGVRASRLIDHMRSGTV
jgi:lysozyme